MAEGPNLHSTRFFETREWRSNIGDLPFSSIHSGIRAQHRDSRNGDISGDSVNSKVMDLCTRLPPPPIPPWLEKTPEKLHKMLSNCSCWNKYAELCSIHIPYLNVTSLARTQSKDETHRNDELEEAVPRFLPFLAAITVGLLMVAFVALVYFWHQKKQRRFSCTVKYLKQTSPTRERDYCAPNFYMTPNVTVETQLSLCALVEDGYRGDHQQQAYSIYKEDAWPYGGIDGPHSSMTRSITDTSLYDTLSLTHNSPCRRNANEILLQPDRLQSQDNDERIYYPASNIPIYSNCHNDGFDASRSLSDGYIYTQEGHKDNDNSFQGFKQRQSNHTSAGHPHHHSAFLNDNTSPYVQIESLHDFPDVAYEDSVQSNASNQHLHQSGGKPPKRGNRVVKKCKDARNRVMDKLPWKRTVKTKTYTNQPTPSNTKFQRPINVLRQSLKGLRMFSQRRINSSNSSSKHNNSVNWNSAFSPLSVNQS